MKPILVLFPKSLAHIHGARSQHEFVGYSGLLSVESDMDIQMSYSNDIKTSSRDVCCDLESAHGF